MHPIDELAPALTKAILVIALLWVLGGYCCRKVAEVLTNGTQKTSKARRESIMQDQLGNTLKVGDRARVTAIDAGRGAIWGTIGACTIIAIKRTRAEVQCDGRTGTDTIGPELLRVMAAVDGRDILTFDDVDTSGVGMLKPCGSYPRLAK